MTAKRKRCSWCGEMNVHYPHFERGIAQERERILKKVIMIIAYLSLTGDMYAEDDNLEEASRYRFAEDKFWELRNWIEKGEEK